MAVSRRLRHSKCQFAIAIVLYLILNFITSITAEFHVQFSFDPPRIDKLLDNDSIQYVNVSYFINSANHSAATPFSIPDLSSYQLRCSSTDNSVAQVELLPSNYEEVNGEAEWDQDKKQQQTPQMLTRSLLLRGQFIGKVKVHCELQSLSASEQVAAPRSVLESNKDSAAGHLSVWVVLSSQVLNRIFLVTLIALCIIANCMLGCELNMTVVKDVLKRPVAPAIGFAAQFILMPLIAFAIAYAVMFPAGLYTLGLGVFTTGCSPGGGASNYWTLLMNGNTDLSITMTFMSTVAALVMMPAWMYLLGDQFLVGHASTQLQVPYSNIGKSLIVLVLPLVIGMVIRKYRPEQAMKAKKVLRPFIVLILVLNIVFLGSYANSYMFYLMTPRVLLAGLLLPWCGFMFGCFSALIFRQSLADVSAIAIETGIQNTGISIKLLKLSFDHPDCDIASVVPVVSSIFTPVPLLTAVFIHWIMRKSKSASEHSLAPNQPIEDGEVREGEGRLDLGVQGDNKIDIGVGDKRSALDLEQQELLLGAQDGEDWKGKMKVVIG